jgi:hypothetical protein
MTWRPCFEDVERQPRERRVVEWIDRAMSARSCFRTSRDDGGDTGVSVVRMVLIIEVTAADGNCAHAMRAQRRARKCTPRKAWRVSVGVRRFSAPAS